MAIKKSIKAKRKYNWQNPIRKKTDPKKLKKVKEDIKKIKAGEWDFD
tara:strand:- start:346 stop:486 length:141 start_codon:yes stop_codon:yes gene_type:complete